MNMTMPRNMEKTRITRKMVPQGQPRLCSFTRSVCLSTPAMFWSVRTFVLFSTYNAEEHRLKWSVHGTEAAVAAFHRLCCTWLSLVMMSLAAREVSLRERAMLIISSAMLS